MNANNNFTLHGRISSDVALKGSGDRQYIFFTVAYNHFYNGKTQADFLFCKAFGKTAEFVSKYFKKGSAIAVSGEVRTSKGPDDKFATMYLHVDSVSFVVENTKGDAKAGAPTGYKPKEYTADGSAASAFGDNDETIDDMVKEEDMPF